MDYSTQTASSWASADAPALLETLSGYDHAQQLPQQQQQQHHERHQQYQQQQQHRQNASFKLEQQQQQPYGDSFGSAFDSDFLNLDQYLVPEQLDDGGYGALNNYAPLSASLSYGTPSPALPALSPPSTAGTSYESSPTGSSYEGLISPHVLPPPHTTAPAQQPSFLLPAADIFNTSETAPMHRDAQLIEGSSCSAQMQDSYLQQHAQAYSAAHPPSTPLRTRTISEGVPSSTTPRGQAQNAHVYRSPGSNYSPSSSPTKSPYARTRTPVPFAGTSPSRAPTFLQRSHSQRSPTKADGSAASESPDRRRQSRLSIAVPPYQPRSSRNRLQHSRELPPDAASGFHIVGDVELEATQEMEQLLGQLGSFLGPDATANESPQLEHRAPPEISRGRTVGGSYGQHLGAPQAVAPPPTSFGGSIDISGVRLSEEDMALLDEPDYDYDHRQYPASAPAWQTSFNFGPSGPHPPFQSRSNALHYTAAPLSPHYPAPQYTSASLAPPLAYSHADFDAPLSAPLRPRSTPILEQQATFAAPPPVSGSGVRRRRSSVDDVASYAHASPIYAINSSYTYDQQPNPSQSYPYARPAPTQRHTYSTSPSASSMSSASSPVAVHRLPGQAATPRTSPTKIASPRKTRTSPTKKKGAGGLPMFVNFGASDSKKLLSGVAPSGSSKRRREEQEAAAAAAAASSSS